MAPLIPPNDFSRHALAILEALRTAGHTAYLAGGCVRDALLGNTPKDFDVATNATPEVVRELFGRRRTLAIGASFGVIHVLPPRGCDAQVVEVATFRSDGQYSDGRHPDSVQFGDPQADAQRRDFTINGLFYDPANDQVIDFVGGQQDLAGGCIRAIGVAEQRFEEDKLRMLRAVRFAAAFDFSIDHQTAQAVRAHAAQITVVSGERIGAEMRRMLASDSAPRAVALLHELQLATHVMPLAVAAACQQPDTLAWLAARRQPDVITGLAILAAPAGRRAVAELFEAWRLSASERDAADFALSCYRTLLDADQRPWSAVQPLLIGRYVDAALALAEARVRADARTASHDPTPSHSNRSIAWVKERLSWPRERLDPPPLIDGDQLRALGMTPGPHFREILAATRAAQLDGKIQTVDQAVALAKQF